MGPSTAALWGVVLICSLSSSWPPPALVREPAQRRTASSASLGRVKSPAHSRRNPRVRFDRIRRGVRPLRAMKGRESARTIAASSDRASPLRWIALLLAALVDGLGDVADFLSPLRWIPFGDPIPHGFIGSVLHSLADAVREIARPQ